MMPSSEVSAVLVHEGIDAAVLVAVGARRLDQPRRQLGDPLALVGAGRRSLGEAGYEAHLVLDEMRRDLVARQRLARLGGHARVSTAVRPVILNAAV